MNDTLDNIDVSKFIEREDFERLFTSQLDLTQEEIEKIHNVYYPLYTTFIENKVSHEDSWVAARNTFMAQETEIAARHQKQN